MSRLRLSGFLGILEIPSKILEYSLRAHYPDIWGCSWDTTIVVGQNPEPAAGLPGPLMATKVHLLSGISDLSFAEIRALRLAL